MTIINKKIKSFVSMLVRYSLNLFAQGKFVTNFFKGIFLGFYVLEYLEKRGKMDLILSVEMVVIIFPGIQKT